MIRLEAIYMCVHLKWRSGPSKPRQVEMLCPRNKKTTSLNSFVPPTWPPWPGQPTVSDLWRPNDAHGVRPLEAWDGHLQRRHRRVSGGLAAGRGTGKVCWKRQDVALGSWRRKKRIVQVRTVFWEPNILCHVFDIRTNSPGRCRKCVCVFCF